MSEALRSPKAESSSDRLTEIRLESPALPSQRVMPGLVPGIHALLKENAEKAWMAGTSPLLSGLVLVDKAHGVDSSVFRASGNVSGHG
ncbi:hypothetical protein, partial [Rhodopseudomonas palustris]|uniref:hypothetical protein n=1 Tax=Rhodopseudomonas palustris TaxID=1076 RepID=UPI001AED0552